jgi:hypothetical protein
MLTQVYYNNYNRFLLKKRTQPQGEDIPSFVRGVPNTLGMYPNNLQAPGFDPRWGGFSWKLYQPNYHLVLNIFATKHF